MPGVDDEGVDDEGVDDEGVDDEGVEAGAGDGGLREAYLRTQVRVSLPGGGEALLEQAPAGVHDVWPFPGAGHAWIITACNPRSVELSEPENLARHIALGRELAELGGPAYGTTGFDPRDSAWHEPGYVVPGLPDCEADRLARRWEQNALFLWEPRRFSLVGVLMPGDAHHGWRLVGVEGPDGLSGPGG